jgi:hypothetical protein
LVLGVLTSLPWVVNLEQGQSSGLIALSLALGAAFMRRGRDWTAGLAFGLLFLKVQWLPLLVLVLLLKGRWRALGGLAVAGIALVALATLVLGPGWIPAYLGVLTSASRSGTAFLLTPAASHSLNGGIYAVLGPGGAALVGPLNLLGTMAVAALVGWLWLRVAGWQPGTPAWDATMGLTILAAIFINPQLNTHDLSLLIVPAVLGFAFLYRTGVVRENSGSRSGFGDRLALAWHLCLWLLYFLYFTPWFSLDHLLNEENPLPIRLTTWLLALMLGLLAAMAFRSIGSSQLMADAHVREERD